MKIKVMAEIFFAVFMVTVSHEATAQDSKVFQEAGKLQENCTIQYNDAKLSRAVFNGKSMLRLSTGTKDDWPGVSLRPKGAEPWNLSGYNAIGVELANDSNEPRSIYWRIDNMGGDGNNNCIQLPSIRLNPGERIEFLLSLGPGVIVDEKLELSGVKGAIKANKITQMIFFKEKPVKPQDILIGDIKLYGKREEPRITSFLPFMDNYGQFIHIQWPGKTKTDAELVNTVEAEKVDLVAAGQPKEWNKYGGWAGGPTRIATGNFRTEKFDGQWWLVDPDGKLFWSVGINCVRTSCGKTKIKGREQYFTEFPQTGPLTNFMDASGTYNYSAANLFRKYGEDWQEKFRTNAHERLRSWRLNTLGNWSDAALCAMSCTPYTVPVETISAKITKSDEGKMPDPFDASFAKSLATILSREAQGSGKDPMCIGYFLENELPWKGERLAVAVLEGKATSAAKKAMIDGLRIKYGSIAGLNSAWGAKYSSWDEMLEATAVPDLVKAQNDLLDFNKTFANQFFKVASEQFKQFVPGKLLLGCRFAAGDDDAIRAAAAYCDVVSFNRYTFVVDKLKLPEGVDKPIIIGEFHYGAGDRGLFMPGVRIVANQVDRGEAYKNYLKSALQNPALVGAHWFQFADQPASGRSDGENYQIGFVDICDRPYPETIAAAREIGENIYSIRTETQKK